MQATAPPWYDCPSSEAHHSSDPAGVVKQATAPPWYDYPSSEAHHSSDPAGVVNLHVGLDLRPFESAQVAHEPNSTEERFRFQSDVSNGDLYESNGPAV